jgi:carbamate kinase
MVVALGGNALLRRGEPLEAEVQRHNIELAVDSIVGLCSDHRLVVTHGNGPQVGLLALLAESYTAVEPYPLDVLGAESEGMIGYLLERELRSRLPEREVATLLTQVRVDIGDPAFERPTKPIGPIYPDDVAETLRRQRGWQLARDGDGWRRVVPSPEPLEILELGALEILVRADAVVVCAGGGGVPVVLDPAGGYHGVEGVIDKDLAAALLARRLGASALLLLTDVDAVYEDWGTPGASPLREASTSMLRALSLPEGSMGPKVEAACRFAEATGGLAAIGRLEDAELLARGEAGTVVRRRV